MPRWVPKTWELPPEITKRLGRDVGRQRTMYEAGHMLVILHALPKPDQDLREARVFWRAPDGQWRSSALGKGARALGEHIAEYQKGLDALEQQAAEASLADDYFQVLEQANPVVRACRNMQAALQYARESLPEEADLISYRDDSYNLVRNAELLVTDTRDRLDLYLARKTEEMNKASHSMAVAGHRLNVLAAVFLPMATLASVLGMNVPFGFEQWNPPIPFIATIVLGAVLGAGVKSWLEGGKK